MRNLAMYFLSLILILSCKSDKIEPNYGNGDVKIRVWNGTGVELNELYVNTGGGENEFGSLAIDQKSVYKGFKFAYRYAFVTFKIDGMAYAVQPIDYFGETKLSKGFYTYKISKVDRSNGSVELAFIEE